MITMQLMPDQSEVDRFKTSDDTKAIHVTDIATSKFYNQTILRGAAKPWDRERIQSGKLAQYKAIGAKEVEIETENGGIVHGCYFDTKAFLSSIAQMGGFPIQLSVSRNLPHLQLAEAVNIHVGEDQFPAVRIQSKPGYEFLFRDLSALRNFCKSEGFELLNEDFTPAQDASYLSSWLPWSSTPRNLIVARPLMKVIARKNPETRQIQPADIFHETFLQFSPKSYHTQAIYFPKDKAEEAKNLFEALKINNSTWGMVENEKGLFILPQEDLPMMLSEHNGAEIEHQSTAIPMVDRERGVVLMTMNQSNSYFQYSHEILTFLLAGTNVFAYDNFGKGLSVGYNTQQGIVDSIDGAYKYLRLNEGFRDDQILAKGQCAGGPPASELGRLHPQIHVWIDQAPSGYHHMVPSLYGKYLNQGIQELEKKDTLATKALATVGGALMNSNVVPYLVSKTLPDFDVAENLRRNHGSQLFTIGVPNQKGQGGDTFVPQDQQDAIVEAIIDTKGQFVPMPGAEHVTDWWLIPLAKEQVLKYLADTHIASPLLDSAWAGTTPVSQNYTALCGSPYVSETAKREQRLLMHLLLQVSSRWTETDLPRIREKIGRLVDMTGPESKRPILKAMVEVAKATNKPMLALHLELEMQQCSQPHAGKDLFSPPLYRDTPAPEKKI